MCQLYNQNIMRRIVLVFMMVCSLPLWAMQLHLIPTSGEQQSIDLALVGKWIFQGEQLQLISPEGVLLASEETGNIKKIVFDAESGKATDLTGSQSAESQILVYPNPTNDILYVQGVGKGTSLRVFSMQGELLISAQGNECSVEELPVGTYLLQIGVQVVRFIKQ